MTLKGLDIQEDCIKAISNESLIFDIKNLCTRQISQNPYPIRILPS